MLIDWIRPRESGWLLIAKLEVAMAMIIVIDSSLRQA